MKNKKVVLFGLVFFLNLPWVPALAVPITYTVQGIGAGEIFNNNVASVYGFTGFTLKLNAQTSNVINITNGVSNAAVSASLSLVLPAMSDSISLPLTVSVDHSINQISISTATISDPIFLLSNSVFGNFGLDSNLGPIASQTTTFFGFNQGIQTAFGRVTLNAIQGEPTFAAQLSPGANNVPEPEASGLLLIGIFLLILAAFLRQNDSKSDKPYTILVRY